MVGVLDLTTIALTMIPPQDALVAATTAERK
jgi:hypothetical protein